MGPIIEHNNTIATAVDLDTPPAGAAPVVLAGEVGDTAAGADDVDLVSFALDAGDVAVIETRAEDPSTLDTFLRLFGPDGAQVAFDDDRPGSFASRVVFAAPTAGIYAAGVSSVGDSSYDPTVAGSGAGRAQRHHRRGGRRHGHVRGRRPGPDRRDRRRRPGAGRERRRSGDARPRVRPGRAHRGRAGRVRPRPRLRAEGQGVRRRARRVRVAVRRRRARVHRAL